MATEVRRKIGEAHTGVFQHINEDGEVEYKMYNSCNEDLKVNPAKRTNEVGRIRVEVTEVVDTKVKDDNSNYSKNVKTKQFMNGSGSKGSSNYIPDMSHTVLDKPQSADPSPLQVLKNFVDNISADVRNHGTWLIILGILGAVALGFGIAAIAWLASIA